MSELAQQPSGQVPFNPSVIKRPDSSLLKYYIIIAILTGPAFPLVFIPLFFKYETLKYSFEKDGVSMSWGVLWRREIHLTYRRIQDIHLTRNFIQRWLGLATVSIQTASGAATPEMSIEGILQADHLRDYFYSKMRGAKDPSHELSDAQEGETNAETPTKPAAEALVVLQEIRDLLRDFNSREG